MRQLDIVTNWKWICCSVWGLCKQMRFLGISEHAHKADVNMGGHTKWLHRSRSSYRFFWEKKELKSW